MKKKKTLLQFIWQMCKLRPNFSENFPKAIEISCTSHHLCEKHYLLWRKQWQSLQAALLLNILLFHSNWKCYENSKKVRFVWRNWDLGKFLKVRNNLNGERKRPQVCKVNWSKVGWKIITLLYWSINPLLKKEDWRDTLDVPLRRQILKT